MHNQILRTSIALALIGTGARAAEVGPTPGTADTATLESVIVTGSHIPRTEAEGAAPVISLSAEDLRNSGFTSMSQAMSALTGNLGALDNNQTTNGFSPGAQAVDLHGLGPNHTLVLINGRRIADYPQLYQGTSNFTDISSIPLSMVDRIEILSGSASAIYGSDAISGVINFILKKKADGLTVDLRAGSTQHGGGTNERAQFSGGVSTDRLDAVVVLEFLNEQPVWAFQRSNTNSRLNSPNPYASPVFVREDQYQNYYDPPASTCAALAGLDQNSIVSAYRNNYGNYCGSYKDVGYGTLQNGKKAINLYGTLTYKLNDDAHLFLDVMAGGSNQDIYNTPLQWSSSYVLNGRTTDTPFLNQATGLVEQWQRKYFTFEENGGLDTAMIHNHGRSVTLNGGVQGAVAGTHWRYEVGLNFSQNQLDSYEPAILESAIQNYYLGQQLGVDVATGLPIYNAPVNRLYTPLTTAQFKSFVRNSTDHDTARQSSLNVLVNNDRLMTLPGGPVGIALLAEAGRQSLDMQVDPLTLNGGYYSLGNVSATGSRTHAGAGVELKLPLLEQVVATAASRFDRYSYGDTSSSKGTYSLGLEYRPFRSLLVRGSFGTGFRAPDLAYLYSGLSNSSSGGTDYYLCRLNEPSTGPDYANNCSLGSVSFNGRSNGNIGLKDETSQSLTAGIVFNPVRNLEFTADYYQIALRNEVTLQSSDTILRQEADCRLGQTIYGTAVNTSSGLCQQVLGQVVRNPSTAFSNPNQITSVTVLPINAAVEKTSGVDLSAQYRIQAGAAGRFDLRASLTDVLTHSIQLHAGDAVDNELTDYYYYVIPRYKATYGASWTLGRYTTTLFGTRIGGLPNYDGTVRLAATDKFNGTFHIDLTGSSELTISVTNLFDTKPQKDPSWTSYPYYATQWFDSIGRAFTVQWTAHFRHH
jgi:outer membrane receptor protein involved in Fe transport